MLCVWTFKSRVEQIFTTRAQESVAVNQIQSAQEQMIRVHQIITDHWEVSYRTEDNIFFYYKILIILIIYEVVVLQTENTFLVLVGTYFGMNMFPTEMKQSDKRITVKS